MSDQSIDNPADGLNAVPHTSIQYCRLVNGQRVRYRMQLDSHLTCIADEPIPEEPRKVAQASAALAHHRRQLQDRGITFNEQDGKLVITAVPPLERAMLNFFVPGHPCFFDGCEGLRTAYNQEIANLGSDCADCDKSKVAQRYREMIKPLVQLSMGAALS